jgi:hypothetical protein
MFSQKDMKASGKSILSILLLPTVSANYYLTAQSVPCETAPVLAATGGTSWPQGASITVIINPN